MPSKFWGSGRSVVRAFKGIEDWGRWREEERRKAAEAAAAQKLAEAREARETGREGREQVMFDLLFPARKAAAEAGYEDPEAFKKSQIDEGALFKVLQPLVESGKIDLSLSPAVMSGKMTVNEALLRSKQAQPSVSDFMEIVGSLSPEEAERAKRVHVGLLPRPSSKEPEEPKPSATARILALPDAPRAFAVERLGGMEEEFGRALTGPESTAVAASAEREFKEEEPSKADVDVGTREIMAAGKAAGLIAPGQNIVLTDRGIETAAWLGSTVGGYTAQNKRTTAQNRLRSTKEIAKLFTLTDEKADDEE